MAIGVYPEGSSGRRKGPHVVYGVTTDIGVNLSGAVGNSGVSVTALKASNAPVNQRCDADKMHTATYNGIQRPLTKLVWRLPSVAKFLVKPIKLFSTMPSSPTQDTFPVDTADPSSDC